MIIGIICNYLNQIINEKTLLYLIFIWWLFDEYLMSILLIWLASKWTTHPISSGYVAAKYQWPGLHTQKRWSRICCIHHCEVTPVHLVTLMSAMTIILMQGCKLAITDFAFETQEWLGLPALRLTLLTAHWQPKQWLQTNLSKMVRTSSKPEIMIICVTNDSCRIHGQFYSILTSNRRKEIR